MTARLCCSSAGRMVAASIGAKVNAVKPEMDEFTAFLAVGWNYGIIDTFEELMRARGYAGRCFRRPSAWEPGKVEPAVLADLLVWLQRLEDMAAAL